MMMMIMMMMMMRRTHDKTKVNVLMSASELIFKFIQLYYVG